MTDKNEDDLLSQKNSTIGGGEPIPKESIAKQEPEENTEYEIEHRQAKEEFIENQLAQNESVKKARESITQLQARQKEEKKELRKKQKTTKRKAKENLAKKEKQAREKMLKNADELVDRLAHWNLKKDGFDSNKNFGLKSVEEFINRKENFSYAEFKEDNLEFIKGFEKIFGKGEGGSDS